MNSSKDQCISLKEISLIAWNLSALCQRLHTLILLCFRGVLSWLQNILRWKADAAKNQDYKEIIIAVVLL